MNTIPVIPLKKIKKINPQIPGSKSITNRALILAVLRNGKTFLKGALFSEDTRVMISCLRALGIEIEADEVRKTISIVGTNGEIPIKKAKLFVANAGTAARFLTALLVLGVGGEYYLDGTEAMQRRPMQGLINALKKMGCEFVFHKEENHFPFTIKSSGVVSPEISVDASASSQILSALLQIAPMIFEKKIFSVHLVGETVSLPFLEMTRKMILQFGGAIESTGKTYFCSGGYSAGDFIYAIEPDATAASYFAIIPFVHPTANVVLDNFKLDGLQGDAEFIIKLSTPPSDILNFTTLDNNVSSKILITRGACETGFEMDFNAISDTFLTLAAVAPLFAKGNQLKIKGIFHTRHQECDRIFAMATELRKIVGKENIIEEEDSLTIISPGEKNILDRANAQEDKTIHIETYKDHRVAMCFAILGTFDLRKDGTAWMAIDNPKCCEKTFPDFFERLDKIR